jgi:hypothetical protein
VAGLSRTITDTVEELRLPEHGAFIITNDRGLELFRVNADGPSVRIDRAPLAAASGAHPDLATHDSLGLATQAELDVHAAAGDPHPGYLTAAEGDAAYADTGHGHNHTGLTGVDADQHHAQLHAAAHQPGGGDALAVDAAAATGSLRTLGAGTAQAAPGDHAHGGGGAPADADYLVGTAHAGLSGEIVAGAVPGGELGGTWGSPTVDAAHSGTTHAATQAAAEATAAAAAAAHVAAADPHTGYVREADANWTDLTDAGETALHSHAGGGGGLTGDQIVDLLYPVGALYVSTLATNPGTLLAHGTWVAFGAGRVMVGIDAGQAEFDTVEETGGAKTHTLASSEMPAHVHNQTRLPTATGGSTGFTVDTSMSGTPATTSVDTGSTGGGGAHNNLQPFIVVYMWKRTA